MKVLLNADVFGWRMTGLMGKNARWFFGFSCVPAPATQEERDRFDAELREQAKMWMKWKPE